MKKKLSLPKITGDDYFTCSRCKIDSLSDDEMCPCPRGGCEAAITGTIITTTILQKQLTKSQEEWNKKNYRVVSKDLNLVTT